MLIRQNFNIARSASFGSLLALGLALTAACSSDKDNPNNGGTGSLQGPCYPNGTCMPGLRCSSGTCISDSLLEGDGGGGQTQPGGPKFLTFASDVKKIGPSDRITITAVLTDADGVDDIIGGDLKEGDATYGAFVTSANEGAYTMTLTWDQLNYVKPINFAMRTDGTRTLTAEFYDVAGHLAKSDITLTLSCKGNAACNGSCMDTDPLDGKCVAFTECIKVAPTPSTAPAITCNDLCTSKGQKCLDACGGGYGARTSSTCSSSPSGNTFCATRLNSTSSTNVINCCCTQ